jgi:tetratricopeptide (TPR) repeat protein
MKKKILFSLLSCLILITVLEIALRLFFPDPAPRLFIPSDREKRFYTTNPYFLKREYKKASFEMPKPQGVVRIFCLGGSTTAGYFPDLMGKMLIILSPDRRFEVVNCGRHSLGIANVAERLDELAAFDPDVFVLYSGHNEFMINNLAHARESAERPFFMALRRGLEKLHIYRSWRRLILRSKSSESASVFYTLPLQIHRMDALPRTPLFTEDDYRIVVAHYRRQLERIIAFSRKRGITLLASSLVCNLRDFNPSVSILSCPLDEHAEEKWRQAYSEGKSLYESGDFDAALARLSDAEALCDTFADLHFVKGKIFEARHDDRAALEAFEKAKDLDGVPFRAISAINGVLTDTCRREKVPLFDAPASLRKRSPGGLVGHNLIVDNVHPSPEGAFLIALGFCEMLEQAFREELPGGFRWPGAWEDPFEMLGLNDDLKSRYYIYLARYTAQLAALTRNKAPRIALARAYLDRAGAYGRHPGRIARASRYLDLLEKDPVRAIELEYGTAPQE